VRPRTPWARMIEDEIGSRTRLRGVAARYLCRSAISSQEGSGGPAPQTLTGPIGLANRAGASPVHSPCRGSRRSRSPGRRRPAPASNGARPPGRFSFHFCRGERRTRTSGRKARTVFQTGRAPGAFTLRRGRRNRTAGPKAPPVFKAGRPPWTASSAGGQGIEPRWPVLETGLIPDRCPWWTRGVPPPDARPCKGRQPPSARARGLGGRIRTCVVLVPGEVGDHYPTPRDGVAGGTCPLFDRGHDPAPRLLRHQPQSTRRESDSRLPVISRV
jgi:hypothetical protein